MPSVDHSEKVFGKHPTQKPEGVIKRAILVSSNTGDVVFDPFYGSGTTGVVRKKQNRKFVGIDSNIEYLNIAKKDWLQQAIEIIRQFMARSDLFKAPHVFRNYTCCCYITSKKKKIYP